MISEIILDPGYSEATVTVRGELSPGELIRIVGALIAYSNNDDLRVLLDLSAFTRPKNGKSWADEFSDIGVSLGVTGDSRNE